MLIEVADPKYPLQNAFVDFLLERLALKNDAALCRELKVAPPIISKVRNGRMNVTPYLLLRVHEVTGLSVAELRTHLSTQLPAAAEA